MSDQNQEFYLERRSDDDFADLYDVQFFWDLCTTTKTAPIYLPKRHDAKAA